MATQRFELGQVVATPGAIEAMNKNRMTPAYFLGLHQSGEWGVLSDADKRANDAALKDGSRIMSAYIMHDKEKLWVITEAVGDDDKRASTCLLLPDEY
ncbi:MAG: hypothetical protein JWM57_531 [Phycisphaerales bacterium]|nr:hypothetical protein [Phycisphaerales bacterium]